MDYSSWYEKTYPELSGYGLWLRGGELNTLAPRQFDVRPLRVLITRLSTYRDTAHSFTHKLLYQILAGIDDVYPDLAYLPPPRDASIMDRDGVPWLLGTSSQRGPRGFSIIAFSLSIVQEMLNIQVMMKKSGIPLGKQERMADGSIPLVIAGGASALYTSLLFRDNPLVDGIFVGGDADTIKRIFQICCESMAQGLTKRDVLTALTEVPGFFEPDKPKAIAVRQNPRLPEAQLLQCGPVLYDEEIIGKGSLQLSEGCACFCSFCAEGFSHKPYREFDAQILRGAARRMKAYMAVSELELYSFNFASFRDFYRLLWELSALFPSLRLKSQRMDSIAQDPGLLDVLHAMGKSSMTCAIEGISPRLRRYLHKSLDDAALEKSLARLLQARLRELKIFLIATGLELDEDFIAFHQLLEYMQTILRGQDSRPRIIFSVTILVRFPWTPLEFADAPRPQDCERVVRRIERAVRGASFECRVSAPASDYWVSQMLVRASDAAVADAVRGAQEETGFVFYREIAPPFADALRQAFEEKGIGPDAPLKASSPSMRHTAPWAGLQTGVDPAFLEKQWRLAQAFVDEGYCGPAINGGGACRGCTACPDHETRQALLSGPAMPPVYSARQLKNRLNEAAAREFSLYFKVAVGPLLRGIPRSMRSIALARAMMLADDRLIDAFRRCAPPKGAEALQSDWLIGDDVIALAWDGGSREMVLSLASDQAFIERVNGHLEQREVLVGMYDPALEKGRMVAFRSWYTFDPSRYCKRKSLKFTVRRLSGSLLCYEFAKDSLKKSVILDCSAERASNGAVRVSVVPGAKFDAEEFARMAFIMSRDVDWVRIEMHVRRT